MKKPIIGIISRCDNKDKPYFFAYDEYRLAIIKSGGIPFLIFPPYQQKNCNITPFHEDVSLNDFSNMEPLLKFCDGFLFPGGDEWYGFEQVIYQYAFDKDKPVLGICLGMQMIACSPYFLYQNSDFTAKIHSSIDHHSLKTFVHSISLSESKLKKILKADEIYVNSRHYSQVLKNYSFEVSSISKDGVIESIEIPNKKFIIGVQWHPETTYDYDIFSQKIFKEFIKACF